jgi:hypothetical protein
MNFKDFKKVDVTKTHTVFQHPNGHTIHISHDSLTPEQKKQMRGIPVQSAMDKLRERHSSKGVERMYEGGETPYYSPQEKEQMESDPEYAKFLAKVKTEHPEAYAEMDRKAKAMEMLKSTEQPTAPVVPPMQATPVMQSQPTVSAAKPSFNLDLNQYLPQQPQQPNETVAQQPQQPTDVYRKSLETETKAGQEIKNIQQQEQEQQAKSIQGVMTQLQQTANYYTQEKDRVRKMRERVQREVLDQDIDPNRYVGNMSTMGRVSTALGLILGGIGAGMTGGKNLAFEALQNAIDRDVDAQKLQLDKKNNLLTAYYKIYGDMEQAEAATKAQLMSMAQMQAGLITAKSQSKQAEQQNAILQAQAAAKIQQYDDAVAQVSADKQLSEITKVPTAPKPSDEQVFSYIDRKPTSDKQKDSAKEAYVEYFSGLEGIEVLKQLMNDQAKLSELTSYRSPADRAQLLSTYKVALAPIVKSVTGETRMSDQEFKTFVDPLISKVYTDPETIKKQINILIQSKFPDMKKQLLKLKGVGLHYEMPLLEQTIPSIPGKK